MLSTLLVLLLLLAVRSCDAWRGFVSTTATAAARTRSLSLPRVWGRASLRAAALPALKGTRMRRSALLPPRAAPRTSAHEFDPIDWEAARELISSVKTSGFDPEEEHPQLQELTRRVMAHCAQKRIIPREVMETLLEVSTARHAQMANVVQVRRATSAVVHTNKEDKKDKENDNSEKEKEGSVVIVGDTHGQFFDFLHVLSDSVAGPPSRTNRFVVNGDVVDRGKMAVEILGVILLQKLSCDVSMTLLRGNHEFDDMCRSYGFCAEVARKYPNRKSRIKYADYHVGDYVRSDYDDSPPAVLSNFTALFDVLPIAAVVDDKIFVVHGGLGEKTGNMTIDELNQINRQNEEEIDDLLWCDPSDDIEGFAHNEERGGNFIFGADATQAFLDRNKLDLLVRSHQKKMQGFEAQHDGRCMTIFSAPNYCASVGNLGAVLVLGSGGGEEKGKAVSERNALRVIQFGPKHYPPDD